MAAARALEEDTLTFLKLAQKLASFHHEHCRISYDPALASSLVELQETVNDLRKLPFTQLRDPNSSRYAFAVISQAFEETVRHCQREWRRQRYQASLNSVGESQSEDETVLFNQLLVRQLVDYYVQGFTCLRETLER